MASGPVHRAGLLGELRRVEWRRLLLAFALLAVWARLLVPMDAPAARMAADDARVGAICAPDDEGRGSRDAPAIHDERVCPFCRVGEPTLGLAPSADLLVAPRLALLLDARPPVVALPHRESCSHPQPRGPPGPIATL